MYKLTLSTAHKYLIKNNILISEKDRIMFDLSTNCADFINSCLEKDFSKRLDINNIFNHSFLKDYPFDLIFERKIKSPFLKYKPLYDNKYNEFYFKEKFNIKSSFEDKDESILNEIKYNKVIPLFKNVIDKVKINTLSFKKDQIIYKKKSKQSSIEGSNVIKMTPIQKEVMIGLMANYFSSYKDDNNILNSVQDSNEVISNNVNSKSFKNVEKSLITNNSKEFLMNDFNSLLFNYKEKPTEKNTKLDLIKYRSGSNFKSFNSSNKSSFISFSSNFTCLNQLYVKKIEVIKAFQIKEIFKNFYYNRFLNDYNYQRLMKDYSFKIVIRNGISVAKPVKRMQDN